MKTFADHCLELSEKAEPFHIVISHPKGATDTLGIQVYQSNPQHSEMPIHSNFTLCQLEFIAGSSTLVPELARRLKRACEALRRIDDIITPTQKRFFNGYTPGALADELEKPLGEK